MVHHYYRNVNAVVFVFDVTNAASFEVINKKYFVVFTVFILFLHRHWLDGLKNVMIIS